MAKNTDNNQMGKKKKWLSVLPVIGASILAAGALAGSGVSIWHISKNYQASSEFSRSVSARIKVVPDGKSEDELRQNLKITAEHLSAWLKNKGQHSYDVSYEYYSTTDPFKPDCYLNAKFEIEKIKSKLASDEEEKIDNDPYLTFFADNGFNSNDKALVYRWYTKETGKEPRYSIFRLSDLVSIPSKIDSSDTKTKVINNKDGKSGIVFQTLSTETKFNEIYKDLWEAQKYTEEEQKKEEKDRHLIKECDKPRIYLVNNLEGFYSEANYHISNWYANEKGTTKSYQQIYNDSVYNKFVSEAYFAKDWKGDARGTEDARPECLEKAWNKDSDKKDLANASLFNYVDQKTAGNIEYNWMSRYVDKIIKFDSNDFKTYFPKEITDTYKNDINEDDGTAKVSYFWYPTIGQSDATAYLNNIILYGFKGIIQNVDYTTDASGQTITPSGQNVQQTLQEKYCHKEYIPPLFPSSIFGSDNIIPWMCLGFLIFLIILGIILAALYRTTGMFAWICMIFMLSIASLIATLGSMVISMSLLFGLFIIGLIGFIAAIGICERMKRRLKSNEDAKMIVSKTFKKSLWPCVDITIITLAFGICFTYIAPITLNSLGLMLIVGAFGVFVSMYLLNALMNWLFFISPATMFRRGLFGKPSSEASNSLSQGQNNVPSSMDATKLEFGFYSKMNKTKIDNTTWRSIIALIVVGCLLIAGIVVFAIFGFAKSSLFNSSVCVSVLYDGDLLNLPAFKAMNLHYSSYNHIGNWWYFYFNSIPSQNIIQQLINITGPEGGLNKTVLMQDVIGSTNRDTLMFALISMCAAAGIATVYCGIRCNWTTIVPIAIGMFVAPILMLGFASMGNIQFDQIVILGFALAVVINSVFTASIVWSVNESWNRKDAYTTNEYKFIVNSALKNNWTYIWVLGIAMALFLIEFGVTAPIGTNSTVYAILIGFLVTLIIIPFSLTWILYRFLLIRSKAITKHVLKNKGKIRVNLDAIDEQEIEGINKFPKHRNIIVIDKDAKDNNEQKVAIN